MSTLTWLYRWLKEAGCYTVGHYTPDGTWEPESDHETSDEAAARVHYLNGGTPPRAVERDGLDDENQHRHEKKGGVA